MKTNRFHVKTILMAVGIAGMIAGPALLAAPGVGEHIEFRYKGIEYPTHPELAREHALAPGLETMKVDPLRDFSGASDSSIDTTMKRFVDNLGTDFAILSQTMEGVTKARGEEALASRNLRFISEKDAKINKTYEEWKNAEGKNKKDKLEELVKLIRERRIMIQSSYLSIIDRFGLQVRTTDSGKTYTVTVYKDAYTRTSDGNSGSAGAADPMAVASSKGPHATARGMGRPRGQAAPTAAKDPALDLVMKVRALTRGATKDMGETGDESMADDMSGAYHAKPKANKPFKRDQADVDKLMEIAYAKIKGWDVANLTAAKLDFIRGLRDILERYANGQIDPSQLKELIGRANEPGVMDDDGAVRGLGRMVGLINKLEKRGASPEVIQQKVENFLMSSGMARDWLDARDVAAGPARAKAKAERFAKWMNSGDPVHELVGETYKDPATGKEHDIAEEFRNKDKALCSEIMGGNCALGWVQAILKDVGGIRCTAG